MPKPRVVIVLGAGASQTVGIPGTAALSERVLDELRDHDGYPELRGVDPRVARDIRATFPPRVEPLIDSIRRAGSFNFETDMQALESLMTLAPLDLMERALADVALRAEPRDAVGRARPRPPVASLTHVDPMYPALTHRDTLIALMHRLIAAVRFAVETAEERVEPSRIQDVSAFLQALADDYDVAVYSFNYDRTADQAALLAFGSLEDGFSAETGTIFERFDVRQFLDASGIRFAHLHGALDFRVRPRELGTGSSYEVVKIPRGAEIPAGYSDLQEAFTQAGDFAMIGSLISGLHKADKTRTEPYGSYAYALERDLYAAERVVLIGYGGGDTYFNMQLLRARAYHGAGWKAAILTKGVPNPAETLFPLCGALAGLEAPALMGQLHGAIRQVGFGALGSAHLDVRGWHPSDSEQAVSVLRALA